MSPAITKLLSFHQEECDLETLVRDLRALIEAATLTSTQLLAQIRLFDSGFPLGAAMQRLETEFDLSRSDPDATQVAHTVDRIQDGDVIKGRYLLEGEIDRGGMSRVFKAVDWKFFAADDRDHRLAIKFMDVTGVNIDPHLALKLMQREAKRTRKLRHDNIIQVFDFDWEYEGLPFVTMELLDGESLDKAIQRIKPGTIPLNQAFGAIGGMCEGLHYAHYKGFVHADFKPGNVFVVEDGSVKVIDFGIAKVLRTEGAGGDPTRYQAEGALTPPYASPEMFFGEEPDVRDDIYALGVVAYETLTGEHPFAGQWSIHAQRDNLVPRRIPGLSDGQWATLTAAMAFDRAERLGSAKRFKQGLVESASATTGGAGPKSGEGPAGDSKGPDLRSIGKVLSLVVVVPVALGGLLFTFDPVSYFGGLKQPECADCDEFVMVPQGTTGEVGLSRPAAPGVYEYPAHVVSLGKPIYFGKREVSVAEFSRFAREYPGDLTGCRTPESDWEADDDVSWIQPGFAQTGDHPVTCVSWNDATAYAAWLSRTTGQSYRLPSEAEWELVAKRYTSESLMIDPNSTAVCRTANVADQAVLSTFPGLDVVRCNDDHIYTAATDRPGLDGVADMRGNVFEWTEDCWNDNYLDARRNGEPRATGNCRQRVLRGGSWFSSPEQQRLTFRNRADAGIRTNTFGFRLVKEG